MCTSGIVLKWEKTLNQSLTKKKKKAKRREKEQFSECKGKMLPFLHRRQAAWGKKEQSLSLC